MKRILKKFLILGIIVTFGINLIGCSDFDASGYVKALLDATYLGEYESYAEFRNLEVEDARTEVEEVLLASLQEGLTEFPGLSQENTENYFNLQKEIWKFARYEVGEATKENNAFTIPITIEPSDIFMVYMTHVETIATEKSAAGEDLTTPDNYMKILLQSLEMSMYENTYKEPVTITVKVIRENGTYGVLDADMLLIEETLFPSM